MYIALQHIYADYLGTSRLFSDITWKLDESGMGQANMLFVFCKVAVDSFTNNFKHIWCEVISTFWDADSLSDWRKYGP